MNGAADIAAIHPEKISLSSASPLASKHAFLIPPSFPPSLPPPLPPSQLVTRGGKEYIIGLPIDTPVVVVDDKMNALEMGFDKRLPSMLPTVCAPSLPPFLPSSSVQHSHGHIYPSFSPPLPPSLPPGSDLERDECHARAFCWHSDHRG